MLATFILGIAAGASPQFAEPHVKRMLESILLSDAPLGAVELRMYSFAACLLAAALLAMIFGNGSGFALALGACVGVFWPKIMERIQGRRAPDYGDDI